MTATGSRTADLVGWLLRWASLVLVVCLLWAWATVGLPWRVVVATLVSALLCLVVGISLDESSRAARDGSRRRRARRRPGPSPAYRHLDGTVEILDNNTKDTPS